MVFPGGSDGKVSVPTMWETWVRSLGQEDPLEREMATHSSTLAWKIPWTEEHDRLQSMGSQRVRHDWVTSLHPSWCHFDALDYQAVACKKGSAKTPAPKGKMTCSGWHMHYINKGCLET